VPHAAGHCCWAERLSSVLRTCTLDKLTQHVWFHESDWGLFSILRHISTAFSRCLLLVLNQANRRSFLCWGRLRQRRRKEEGGGSIKDACLGMQINLWCPLAGCSAGAIWYCTYRENWTMVHHIRTVWKVNFCAYQSVKILIGLRSIFKRLTLKGDQKFPGNLKLSLLCILGRTALWLLHCSCRPS